MGSKERILRQKESNRNNILEAALGIVKEDGWQALSMRKIADQIEYTAPMIYEYFANKEAILNELGRQGHLKLAKKVKQAKDLHDRLDDQLEAMWISYWNFAFEERELYQLMFGVGTACCVGDKTKGQDYFGNIISGTIREVMADKKAPEELICRKYFTFWSIIHGLISINLVDKGNGPKTNEQVLKDAIFGIIRSLYD